VRIQSVVPGLAFSAGMTSDRLGSTDNAYSPSR
jgi:hypothetical protein